MPKEADDGGRAASGSARKGKRQHASPQSALLDCSLCGKVFSSASSLSKHYLTHSQERKHVCKVCSKAFKRQDHLYVVRACGGPVGSRRLPVSPPQPASLPPAPQPLSPALSPGLTLLHRSAPAGAQAALHGSLFRAPRFTPERTGPLPSAARTPVG